MSPPSRLSRLDRALAFGLVLATAGLMWATNKPIGHVRDEGYYFTAAHDYESWFRELGRDFAHGQVARPFQDWTIVHDWSYNQEHPPLAKESFALSHLLFTRTLGWLDGETAYRLPAFLFAGLLSLALFLLALPWGRAAALLAPALFWAVPRHFFHGHIACFDIPVAAMWCLFLVGYAHWLRTGRGAWTAGLLFGLLLATKHNALLMPPAILAHWLVTNRKDLWAAGFKGLLIRIPKPFVTMAIAGPAVLYVLWPFLWHHPIDRVASWIRFHLHHVNYPWEYFGKELRAPPFPHLYPLGVEAVTLPVATLLLLGFASIKLFAQGAGSFSRALRARAGALDRVDWLLFFSILVAIVPFMVGSTPIFGGIKHWMAGIAVLGVFGARLAVDAAGALLPSHRRLATVGLATCVLVPGAISTAHFQPYGTSAYNELAGGAAGGAMLGMQRQFWSNNVTAVLPWLNQHAPRGALVFFHEVNFESFSAYQREGALRKDIRYAWSPEDATIAVYQYMREFRDREFEIWTEFGTRVPALSFGIDQATQIVVYVRRRW